MDELSLTIHKVELRTLGDLLHRYSLHIECLKCGNFSGLDVVKIMNERGRYCTLYEVRTSAKCSRCRSKNVELLIRDDGIRGDRAWIPRRPHTRRD